MSGALLSLRGVASGYGATAIVRDVALDVGAGEIVAVLGKNGMGKSTLLKPVMGFIRPMAGTVRFDGADASGGEPHRMARAGVAHAPQEQTLFQDMTVEENLRLGAPDDAACRDRLGLVEAVFPRVVERRRQRAGALSGGEQKMPVISRALIARPKIMLVDETSEGLQPTMVDRMAEALTRARAETGVAVLLVEQHLAFTLSVADRFAAMKLGAIVEEGRAGDPAAADVLSTHLQV